MHLFLVRHCQTTGQAPDANMVADLLRTLGETIVAAYLSHAIYNSAFRKPAVG